MKALKEKRISLRSLWRMGLVVLSVFALAFVACGNSDEGGGVLTPPDQSGNTSGPIPVFISVEDMPLQYTSKGEAYEGQKIMLDGIKLNVQSKDLKFTQENDIRRMTIKPNVYVYTPNPAGGPNSVTPYTLTYTSGGQPVETTVYFPNTKRLLDLDVTGQMVKSTYLIDEVPQFYPGLTVNGVYSKDPNDPTKSYPDDTPPNWSTMPGYFREPITLDITQPYHRWAWVWNASANGNPGSFIDDDPGVLLSIGSYGEIASRIVGLPTPSVVDRQVILKGKRVEIERLDQVRLIEVERITSTEGIFYDDPRLVSAVSSEAEMVQRVSNWIEFTSLNDAKIRVYYTGGENVYRDYTIKELQTMGYAYGNDWLNNVGYGGGWANLEIFPVSRAGYKIDVSKDNKTVVGAGDTLDVHDFNWLRPSDDYDVDAPEISSGAIYGDGGWSQWALLGVEQDGSNRSKMGFWWRGIKTQVPVEIYNRPNALTISRKGTYSFEPVLMNGHDVVYGGRPEGMAAFVNKVTIKVDYIIQGDQSGKTKSRLDIGADIAAGKCRAFVQEDPKDPLTKFPSLYSPTIFNWNDIAPAGTLQADRWLYDVPAQVAIQNFGQEASARVSEEQAKQASVLNKATTDRYFTRGTTVRGRIYYRGWAGDPNFTRTVYSQTEVGVIGYDQPLPPAP